MSEYRAQLTEFGDFVRRMRVHRGLSQYALARALGLESAQTISDIERGVVLLPPKHIRTMAEALVCDLEVFAYRMGQIEYHRIMEAPDV